MRHATYLLENTMKSESTMKNILITATLCWALFFGAAGSLAAQESTIPAPDREPRFTAYNVIYAELATMLLTGSISLNYERAILPNLSLRAGYGMAWMFEHDVIKCGQVMANYFVGGDHRLEIGFGVSISNTDATGAGVNSNTIPAFALGYRYQPWTGGVMFRAGGAWSYGYGFPVEISLGYAF